MTRIKTFFPLFIFSLTILLASNAYSAQSLQNGLIHEAYLTPIGGQLLLESAPQEPPALIQEAIPPSPSEDMQWFPGYWNWDENSGEYVWVCGVWRRPPQAHSWIPGFWQQFPQGWVWIHGFWSAIPQSDLTYIVDAPPQPQEENIGTPPGEDFFWAHGYWAYKPLTHDFEWVSGKWQNFLENAVFIRAHYTWRPEGYVFIPAYWDWPINLLGRAYCTNAFKQPPQDKLVLTQVVEVNQIIESTVIYYPVYLGYFWHHWHYNQNYWNNFCCTPPWWHWQEWWTHTWYNHWGVLWWWSHPGYPAPHWLNAKMAAAIPPPHGNVQNLYGKAIRPAIITPNGLVSPHNLIKAMHNVQGKNSLPILPSKQAELHKIFDHAQPTPTGEKNLEPRGERILKSFPKGTNPANLQKDQGKNVINMPQQPTLKIKQGTNVTTPPIDKINREKSQFNNRSVDYPKDGKVYIHQDGHNFNQTETPQNIKINTPPIRQSTPPIQQNINQNQDLQHRDQIKVNTPPVIQNQSQQNFKNIQNQDLQHRDQIKVNTPPVIQNQQNFKNMQNQDLQRRDQSQQQNFKKNQSQDFQHRDESRQENMKSFHQESQGHGDRDKGRDRDHDDHDDHDHHKD